MAPHKIRQRGNIKQISILKFPQIKPSENFNPEIRETLLSMKNVNVICLYQ